MAIPTRASRPGTFFVTSGTYNRRRLFQIPTNAALFVATLQHYRTQGHYKLHAFVVMPDHIHLLLTPQSLTLDQAVALIKTGFAYRLDSALTLWQDGYTAYSIANLHDLELIRGYLHQLPVRANL